MEILLLELSLETLAHGDRNHVSLFLNKCRISVHARSIRY